MKVSFVILGTLFVFNILAWIGVWQLNRTRRCGVNGVDAIYPFIFRVKLSDLKERRREILLKTKQYLYKVRRDSLIEPSRTPGLSC